MIHEYICESLYQKLTDIWKKAMNITLSPNLEQLVKSKVDSGLYRSASELMLDALQLLIERDRLREIRLEELCGEIQRGIDSGPATPLDMDAIKARGREKLAARVKS